MIVSVSGYNCTGSSAVIDLLKEYEEITVVEPEITFIYFPDGLLDLERSINFAATYLCGDVGVERFNRLCKTMRIPKRKRKQFKKIIDNYLGSIVEEKWKGYSSFDGLRRTGIDNKIWKAKNFISNCMYHFFKINAKFCYREMFLAYKEKEFEYLTATFLKKFEELFSGEKEIVVFNQFFSAYNPFLSMKYTPEAKTIVVDRDPRDVYITEKIKKDTICFPTETAEKFIKYQKVCRANYNTIDNNRVLHIKFEDLLYNYEETVKVIEGFLNIKNHYMKQKFFNPDVSINNSQLFLRFHEYESDTMLIGKELREFIYSFPFNRFPEKDFF